MNPEERPVSWIDEPASEALSVLAAHFGQVDVHLQEAPRLARCVGVDSLFVLFSHCSFCVNNRSPHWFQGSVFPFNFRKTDRHFLGMLKVVEKEGVFPRVVKVIF